MSRAVRRQNRGGAQPGGGDDAGGGGGRPPRLFGPKGPRPNRGARPQDKRRRIGLPTWMTEIWSELRKVTWPTFAETRYLTFVVIVVAVAVGIVLGVVDIFFNWLIDQLLLS
jgi:preprotein translocase subunit SecE